MGSACWMQWNAPLQVDPRDALSHSSSVIFRDRAVAQDAGVVHQDVESSVAVFDPPYDGLHGRGIAHVALDQQPIRERFHHRHRRPIDFVRRDRRHS